MNFQMITMLSMKWRFIMCSECQQLRCKKVFKYCVTNEGNFKCYIYYCPPYEFLYTCTLHIFLLALIRHLNISTTDNTPSCQRNEFTCPNDRCIPGELVCNGYEDCANGEDENEENCPTIPETTSRPFVSDRWNCPSS